MQELQFKSADFPRGGEKWRAARAIKLRKAARLG
jgi:hypothetical protein